MYFFEMRAKEAMGIEDEDIAFVMKFLYPDEIISNSIKKAPISTALDMKKIPLYNFQYKLSGASHEIEPLLVFDDGIFTYMKFRNKNAVIPAVFMVSPDDSEGLVNYRISGEYVVIERVSAQFTLTRTALKLLI